MTYRRIAGLFVLMIAAISWPAMADTFAPAHSCAQPVKPEQFNNNTEIGMFNDAVTAYKECIAAFAEEQNRAADLHRDAASDAIDEWNIFVEVNGLN